MTSIMPLDFDDELEQRLNPAPKKYRVHPKVKLGFLVWLLAGLVGYLSLIIERRSAQNQFILTNGMAAIKFDPTPVMPFSMLDPINQQSFALGDFAGNWVLLNLWATWCPPCQEEMPSLENLHKTLGHKLKIVALALDESHEPVVDYIKANNPSFKVLFDAKKRAASIFGVDKYPETFLISPEGKIIAQFSGPRDWSSKAAQQYFAQILK